MILPWRGDDAFVEPNADRMSSSYLLQTPFTTHSLDLRSVPPPPPANKNSPTYAAQGKYAKGGHPTARFPEGDCSFHPKCSCPPAAGQRKKNASSLTPQQHHEVRKPNPHTSTHHHHHHHHHHHTLQTSKPNPPSLPPPPKKGTPQAPPEYSDSTQLPSTPPPFLIGAATLSPVRKPATCLSPFLSDNPPPLPSTPIQPQ